MIETVFAETVRFEEITRSDHKVEVVSAFDGLELVEPGVVPTPLWRPDSGDQPAELAVACGVARKA